MPRTRDRPPDIPRGPNQAQTGRTAAAAFIAGSSQESKPGPHGSIALVTAALARRQVLKRCTLNGTMCLARSHGPFSKPNVARVYDYLLGGKDKCAADREIPGRLLEMCLPLRDVTRENRAVT
jgi:hypothetical protein